MFTVRGCTSHLRLFDFGSKEATVSELLQLPLRPRTRAASRLVGGGTCPDCGYSLRGLLADQPCPECGHFVRDGAHHPSAHTAWGRSVFVGLTLLLVITVHAVCAVLIQPFQEMGGAAPGLNVPGPKLWATPLLQRPLGRWPETPGVVGTRAAMLSLLAVWLITAPCAVSRLQRDQALRLLTRWLSVALFGLAFGTMLTAQGLWGNDLPPLRLLLVAVVELPGALLLYLYLRKLANHVPGRARRAAFDRLAWLVPLVIFVAVVVLGGQWLWRQAFDPRGVPKSFVFVTGAVYGMVAMLVGVAASAAVASLAAAYFHAAFPMVRRWITGARYAARRLRAMRDRVTNDRLRALAIVTGCALLVIVMMLGLDQVLWFGTRSQTGGNLPYLNFPGPKIWAAAGVVPTSHGYDFAPLVKRTTLLMLNLVAVWLLTASAAPSRLRLLARWVPVVSVGIMLGLVGQSYTRHAIRYYVGVDYTSHIFAFVTVVCEVPATLLLYLLLARLARERGRPDLAGKLIALGVAVTLFVAAGIATFALRRAGVAEDHALIIGATFGASSLTLAAWCVAAVLSLAGHAMMQFLGGDGNGAQNEPPRGVAGRVNAFVIEQTNQLITPAPAAVRRRDEHPARPGSRSGR
jgi:hypothetical protein